MSLNSVYQCYKGAVSINKRYRKRANLSVKYEDLFSGDGEGALLATLKARILPTLASFEESDLDNFYVFLAANSVAIASVPFSKFGRGTATSFVLYFFRTQLQIQLTDDEKRAFIKSDISLLFENRKYSDAAELLRDLLGAAVQRSI